MNMIFIQNVQKTSGFVLGSKNTKKEIYFYFLVRVAIFIKRINN